MRTETINEWFFPAEIKSSSGQKIPTAPDEAVEKYNLLREDWLANQPKMTNEVPMVSLSPKKIKGKYQISVRTEVIYK